MFPESQPLGNMGISYEQIYTLSDEGKDINILGCVITNYEKSESQDIIINKIRSADYIHCFDTIIPRYKFYDTTVLNHMPVVVYFKEYNVGEKLYYAFSHFTDEIINFFND